MAALNDKDDFESRPLWELIDKDGVVRSFYTSAAARDFAIKYWPDQQQDPERSGAGWDVQAVQS